MEGEIKKTPQYGSIRLADAQTGRSYGHLFHNIHFVDQVSGARILLYYK
jgi:hypothetical protein